MLKKKLHNIGYFMSKGCIIFYSSMYFHIYFLLKFTWSFPFIAAPIVVRDLSKESINISSYLFLHFRNRKLSSDECQRRNERKYEIKITRFSTAYVRYLVILGKNKITSCLFHICIILW